MWLYLLTSDISEFCLSLADLTHCNACYPFSQTSITSTSVYRYRDNIQRISRIYLDQPLTPLQKAVYWTEYVIRHKGAPHLRSAVLDLAWYQYFLLDVIAVLALVFGAASTVTFLIVRAILRKLCSSTSNTKSVSQNKKGNWFLTLTAEYGVNDSFFTTK